MLGRKGVTLIELLIVVTILSILAGAAIPYVQDYVEDSRIGRAKADIDEIRNALARYEVERGSQYQQIGIASLVGPYLSRSLVDPWGAPYVVIPASSTVLSKGADGLTGGGDDVSLAYRPPMAVSRVEWLDVNGDGAAGVGDSLHVKCSRPIRDGAPGGTGLRISGLGSDLNTGQRIATSSYQNIASFPVNGNFVPGSDTLTISSTNVLYDGNAIRANLDSMKIRAQ